MRSDFEVTCFAYEGIDAIKAALQKGIDVRHPSILHSLLPFSIPSSPIPAPPPPSTQPLAAPSPNQIKFHEPHNPKPLQWSVKRRGSRQLRIAVRESAKQWEGGRSSVGERQGA